MEKVPRRNRLVTNASRRSLVLKGPLHYHVGEPQHGHDGPAKSSNRTSANADANASGKGIPIRKRKEYVCSHVDEPARRNVRLRTKWN